MVDVEVQWIKCNEGSVFCPLETVDLANVNVRGVYLIWHNPSGKVIYVGEGWVADRLRAHRNDPDILRYRGNGLLVTSWAEIQNDAHRLGAELYLARHFNPLVGEHYQNVPPIEVNLPR